jgi:hypothetical protein
MLISAWQKKIRARNDRRDLRTTTVGVELDVYDDAKLGGGGVGPSNACDDAGHATRRDLYFVAGWDALSLRQG